jgi:chromate transport protein ChrA
MIAKAFIAGLVTVFAMVVALTAVMSIIQRFGASADMVGVLVVMAACLIAAGVIVRARRSAIRARSR